MKKRLIIFLISLGIIITVFVLRGFSLKNTARAVGGDLTVNWGVPEGQPIFTITNFAPGQSQTRTVIIANSASSGRPAAVRAIKKTETGSLGDALLIVISEGGTDIYGGTSPTGSKTLTDFFSESSGPNGINLSIVPPGSSKSYIFRVTFSPAAGNQYQGKILSFDLKIGLAIDIPDQCKNMKFNGEIIFGTEGNNNIKGTNQSDLIFGLEGNDNINGGNGEDCIIGGQGNDTIDGGNGKDILFGNEGNDTLKGDNGKDMLFGGPGTNILIGGNGKDQLL